MLMIVFEQPTTKTLYKYGNVHKEIHQAINLTMWVSYGEKCTKLNTSNMCDL
jgi:hypothetical protein